MSRPPHSTMPATGGPRAAEDGARGHPEGVFGPWSRRGELLAAYPELAAACAAIGFAEGPTLGEWSAAPRWALLCLARAANPPRAHQAHDWSMATIPELIAHLVDAHHRPLRDELGRLRLLVDNLSRAHPSAVLVELRLAFTAVRLALLVHLANEERSLFPLCVRLEDAVMGHCPWDDRDVTALLRHTTRGHDDCAGALRRTLAAAHAAVACTADPDLALVDAGLTALAGDLAVHSAEEGDLLIPAAIFAEEQIRARLPDGRLAVPPARTRHRFPTRGLP